jgi:hypothetical protein
MVDSFSDNPTKQTKKESFWDSKKCANIYLFTRFCTNNSTGFDRF